MKNINTSIYKDKTIAEWYEIGKNREYNLELINFFHVELLNIVPDNVVYQSNTITAEFFNYYCCGYRQPLKNTHENVKILGINYLNDYFNWYNINPNTVKELQIINCGISKIDVEMPNLVICNLCNNNISEIPPILLQSTKLELLDLSRNKINNIENIPLSVKVLNLSHNNINIFKNFPSFKYFNLRDNPLNSIEINADDNIIFEGLYLSNFTKENILEYQNKLLKEYSEIIRKTNKKLKDENKQYEEALLHPDSPVIKEMAKLLHETGKLFKS